MCWTMCMAKACSPSRSMGEMSAAMRASRPAGEGEQAADGRGARAVLGAHAAPARDVGHRGQTDERQGTGVERPRSVRSHCAGLSQSCGRGVTRRAPASAGAHRRPPPARLPRSGSLRRRLATCSAPSLGARPTRVLGLRRGGGGRPAAVLGLPAPAALPARGALPALRAAGAVRAALPVAGLGARAGVGAGRLRGPGARARARAEVPRRPRRGRRDGGPDRRRRSAGPARGARRARAGAHPSAAPARARLRPRRLPGRRDRARTGLPVAPCLARGGAPTRQAGSSRAARRAPGRIDVRVRGDPPS